jgi:hypothetical protein
VSILCLRGGVQAFKLVYSLVQQLGLLPPLLGHGIQVMTLVVVVIDRGRLDILALAIVVVTDVFYTLQVFINTQAIITLASGGEEQTYSDSSHDDSQAL